MPWTKQRLAETIRERLKGCRLVVVASPTYKATYTGLLIMYVGLALVSGEQLAIVGLAVVVIAYRRKIRLEEDDLLYAFGGDYDAYRRATWALVPGLF